MNKYFNKKTIFLTLTTILILFLSLIHPQKTEALFGAGDVVFDPANTAQGTITAANTTALSISAYSMQFKEFVLDGLAGMFAKQIIHQLTQSVVNWINSGFEGSPSFVTNPSSFFLDLADQETGRFLDKYGGPLTDLCSPFSIDLRIALAFKYHPNIQKRYTCTIGTIIENSKNAVKGASINGFTAGDFSQGGWPAFVSLTTEPQNNIYGAWIEADSELSLRVANIQLQQRDELNQGKGFLSWKKCTATGNENSEERATEGTGEGTYTGPERSFEGSGEGYVAEKRCEIQTPGSVIVSALESNINGPLHELQLADELNEIVNALFAQLVTQVLQQGLGGVSGNGTGDKNAYINQIIQESPEASQQVTSTMFPNLSLYIKNATEYKKNRDEALAAVVEAKSAYDAARSCLVNKMERQTTSDRALGYIENLDRKVAEDVTPISNKIISESKTANEQLKTLLEIQASTTEAKTVNDLRIPGEKYAKLLQDQSLASAQRIEEAKDELNQIKKDMGRAQNDARFRLQQCILIPSRGFN